MHGRITPTYLNDLCIVEQFYWTNWMSEGLKGHQVVYFPSLLSISVSCPASAPGAPPHGLGDEI